MKILSLILFLFPAFSNAGYLFNGRCYSDPDQVFNSFIQQPIAHHYISSTYPDSDYFIQTTDYNTTSTIPSVSNCPITAKPYCITGPFIFTKTSFTYYNLITKHRVRLFDSAGTPTLLNSYPNYTRIQECNPTTQPFGIEPVNITMNPPPGYDAFLNPSIDWTTTEWIFGSGLVLFALGAGIGSIINITKKARV